MSFYNFYMSENLILNFYNNLTQEVYIKKENTLETSDHKVEIIGDIPRFITDDNYNDRFGYQWNKWRHIQLDSYTELPLTENEIKQVMGESELKRYENLENFKGKYILEAGSGAGRFTEILLKYGAIVDSFDYSSACEANYLNNAPNKNLRIFQADILNMPIRDNVYDYVICIHVIQHTPNPWKGIKDLYKKLKPGGTLVFDQYKFKFFKSLPPPIGGAGNIYRLAFLYLLPKKIQSKLAIFLVDLLFPLHWFFKDSKFIQFFLFRLFPLRFYYPWLGLKNKKQHYEWTMLDTHDSLIDVYKNYANKKKTIKILKELGATDINMWDGGNGLILNCRKPK